MLCAIVLNNNKNIVVCKDISQLNLHMMKNGNVRSLLSTSVGTYLPTFRLDALATLRVARASS